MLRQLADGISPRGDYLSRKENPLCRYAASPPEGEKKLIHSVIFSPQQGEWPKAKGGTMNSRASLEKTKKPTHQESAFFISCGFLQMTFLNNFIIDKDTSAVFTNDNLLSRFDIELPLRGDLIKTATACIPLDRNHSKTISGI